ncbi:hypothetical protein MOQ_008626 [Trypanosoma cruzi marinkellei]|uniref:Uncharacterized protein n=1 Tax=Trypanosoma cruzi marinkellei TaxID=85056 RepID=K2LYE7_TRYCR|nr:hypothetical protein MOQ_008626 [Trypanosoma cruzi marinkellei]
MLPAILGDYFRLPTVRHLQGLLALHVVTVVQCHDGTIGLLRRSVLHKCASLAAVGCPVAKYIHVEYLSVEVKKSADILLGCIKVQLPHKQTCLSQHHEYRKADTQMPLVTALRHLLCPKTLREQQKKADDFKNKRKGKQSIQWCMYGRRNKKDETFEAILPRCLSSKTSQERTGSWVAMREAERRRGGGQRNDSSCKKCVCFTICCQWQRKYEFSSLHRGVIIMPCGAIALPTLLQEHRDKRKRCQKGQSNYIP